MQSSNTPQTTRAALEWLQEQVALFAGVERADVTRDSAGRAVLSVRLSGAEPSSVKERERPLSDGVLSLLGANVAPMLLFDAETLEILSINNAAKQLLGLEPEDLDGQSFADMFAEHEVDRLGRALSLASEEWADQGQWTMRTRAGTGPVVHHWFGPTGRGSQRLVIAAAAG